MRPLDTQPHPARPGYRRSWFGLVCCSCSERIWEQVPDPAAELVVDAGGWMIGRTRRASPSGHFSGDLCGRCR